MEKKHSLAIVALALVTSACSMFEKREWTHAERTAEEAMAATTAFLAEAAEAVAISSRTVAQRMTSYVQRRDLLKTFREAGEYSEDQMLYIVRRASIGGFSDLRMPGMKVFDMPDLPKEYVGEYRWPVDAGVISSEYGRRFGRLHKGMDVAADVGEPIYAMADGYVIYASSRIKAYGNLVILKHDETLTTLYAHNSKMLVKMGERVSKGQLIALLGNTGRSTGPHTHFEFRRIEAALNPRDLLGKGPFDDAPRAQLDLLTEFLVAFRD
jgi:murein DD-endopeptidase MepM/ murein hydrolase activator NlpD